jgi:hypothetical protein
VRAWTSERAVLWLGVTFVVFQLVVSKMWFYLLPCAAPVALLAAAGSCRRDSPLPVRPWVMAACVGAFLVAKSVIACLPDERDMGRLHAAVAKADPTGALPVAILTGSDAWGFQFYADGRAAYLRNVERAVPHEDVGRKVSDAELSAWTSDLARKGGEAILVAEPDNAELAVKRTFGASAEPLPAPEGWRIFRVRGRTGDK